MIWTAQDDERLRALRAEGHSFLKISADLGCTRNAAIGRARRMGLSKPKESHPWRQRAAKAPKPAPTIEPPAAPVPLKMLNTSLLDIGFAECRFPAWDEMGAPDFPCCGQACAGLDSYCEAHMKITGAMRNKAYGHRRKPVFGPLRASKLHDGGEVA